MFAGKKDDPECKRAARERGRERERITHHVLGPFWALSGSECDGYCCLDSASTCRSQPSSSSGIMGRGMSVLCLGVNWCWNTFRMGSMGFISVPLLDHLKCASIGPLHTYLFLTSSKEVRVVHLLPASFYPPNTEPVSITTE